LAHGAAAISIGLGLATFTEWSRRRIGCVIAIAVVAALVLPFALFVLNGGSPLDNAGASFVMAMSSLLTALATRTSLTFGETSLLIAVSDVAAMVFALGLAAWTIRVWQRRTSRALEIKSLQPAKLGDGEPVVGVGFVGE